jgi:hypothetical protein
MEQPILYNTDKFIIPLSFNDSPVCFSASDTTSSRIHVYTQSVHEARMFCSTNCAEDFDSGLSALKVALQVIC